MSKKSYKIAVIGGDGADEAHAGESVDHRGPVQVHPLQFIYVDVLHHNHGPSHHFPRT